MGDADRVEAEVIGGDEELRAEALDLQTACGLRAEALHQSVRREHEERQRDHECDTSERGETVERRTTSARAPRPHERDRKELA